MKTNKLFMDSGAQPPETYPYGKNGIQFDLNGTTQNEPGFKKMAAVCPYSYMGVIETDSKPVLFSTDDTNSAIGFFNPVTELYEPIVDDNPAGLVNWPADGSRLGFKKVNYITGQAQRNYKAELVITFTDKTTFPKYLNCDKPDITRLDDTRLFAFYTPPTIQLTESLGGSLPPGTYYVQVNYEKNDGTISPRSEVSQGLTIAPGEIAGSTDKAFSIIITNADQSYDFLRVTVISKVNGKVTAYELTDLVPISGGTIDLTYTGDNLSSTITLEECLTPPAIYDRIGCMGQLNDALYIGDLHKEADLDDMQPYAALIQLNWISELIDATAPPEEHKLGKKKSFMHEEVYAFYVRYHKKRGGFTKAFTIPGLPGAFADFNTSLEAFNGGETAAINKFKVEDTIPFFNAGSKTGKFGIYVNFGEQYPNTPDFDASPLGGPDLRGQNVRHHKVPSLRWCKQNLYGSVPEYGRTKLDLIGVQASNIVIPAKYVDLIDGYEILYAKRTASNMTIYGQGLVLHGATSTLEAAIPTGNANIYTSGGNWTTSILHEGKGDYDDNWELQSFRQDTFRIHPFDVLLNKPSIKPTYISAQFKLKRDKLRQQGYLEDGSINDGPDAPQVFLVDYTIGQNATNIPSGKQIRKIKNGSYLSMGLTLNKFNNVRHENCFAGQLLGANWPLSYGDVAFRIKGQSYSEPNIVTNFEESYVVNLMALKGNVYSSFYTQKLVSAGDFKILTDGDPFWGGDTFCCDYTFHTYGRHDSVDTIGDGTKGIKVIRRFVCESTSNIHLRYEIPGNVYSKWYPREGLAFNNPDQCYITNFDRSKDPNQFGYTKDLNALNDFISSTIFNPFQETLLDFPYRIHRGGKLSRQSRPRSWRSFLPLDYYEMQKDKGRMINIEGLDDRLLIHMENALFQTQDKAKLDAGVLSVTLGTGDIFQFEPQEAMASKLGYAGTQHDLACVKTPIGYVFFDGKLGEIFILKGQLRNLNEGVDTFLREYLKLKEKNNYIGNGATIGYDQKYKRILLTVKNEKPGSSITIKPFEDTDAFFNALEAGDIILKDGKYYQYQGLNNPVLSGGDCPADPPAPDKFGWVAGDVLCEQDTPMDEVPHEEGSSFDAMSSPALLQWDDITQKMWVADHDQVLGNFYKIDLVTGAKTYVPGMTGTFYSLLRDELNRRIWASSSATGMKILDIVTETVITIPYGTDTALSRMGLWSIGDTVVARDQSAGTLTIIDKGTLNIIYTKNIATDIPSGSTYLTNRFELLNVNGEVWVIPTQRTAGNIAVYSQDFSTLITTITLTGAVAVPGWGAGMFIEAGFYDVDKDKVYIHDTGLNTLFILDGTSRTIVHTQDFFLPPDNDGALITFQLDPVTGALYLKYKGHRESTGLYWDYRVYVIDRTTYALLHVYMNREIQGELVREGASPFMWAAVPGNRSWEGGAWNSDGSLIKYAHGA